jgi:hypothetical protein
MPAGQLDLANIIARGEQKAVGEGREYWLKLYSQCLRVARDPRYVDFPISATLDDAAVALPSRDSLVAQAKDALAIERLAFPPYAGIRFEVEYRR